MLERRLSNTSQESLDSVASRVSEVDLNYHGGGRSVSHQVVPSGGDISEDGHHVLDLTNFDGDDDTRVPGESQMSMRVKKEGKVRRAQSRRKASATQAKQELNQKAPVYSNAYANAEDFNPYNQIDQPVAPLHYNPARVASPPLTQASKTPARPRNWDLGGTISPPPESRGVSLYDPPIGGSQDQPAQRWGDGTVQSARTMSSRNDDYAQPYHPSPLAAPSPTPQPRYPPRPSFPEHRLSAADSIQDRRYSPSPSTQGLFADTAGFDARTLGGSESLRNLMPEPNGQRTPTSTWYHSRDDDSPVFEYDDQEMDDLNVVSEVARPGKPRLDKIITDEVERSKGAVAVACKHHARNLTCTCTEHGKS